MKDNRTDIEHRIELVRQKKGLNRRQFADSISIDPSYYCCLVNKSRKINDRIIRLIAFTHGVNENWLRTGEGEIFQVIEKTDETDQIEFVKNYLIAKFNKLPDELQKDILDFCDRLLASKGSGSGS
ncbi:MAG: helix-turn-helix transcriptional regulator [Planctomycetia bacterium]|nr:helix-turn-helix transcriptional regulator [Planctomycetia bacterium]